MSSQGSKAIPDHLLLTEICVTPTAGEFIEIHNPKGQQVTLNDHYLADVVDYYNIPNTGLGFPSGSSTYDFVVSFPQGSVIDPGEYQVIAMDSSDFILTYGIVPNYCIKGADSPQMVGNPGFVGTSVGLTNNDEAVVLFHWDGVADLVKDVDIVWWGDESSYRVDKSGVSIDSEFDGDGAESTYNNDASTYPSIWNRCHNSGDSFKRIDVINEPDEAANGGNGITGHDETTENLTTSWNYSTAADPTVSVPQEGIPIIHSVEQEPAGNPAPGTDVEVTVNVTDDGALADVNVSISIDGGPFAIHSMNHAGGNEYTHTIYYTSPPMGNGISVRYNISATDDEGNSTFSDDHIFYYLPDTPPVLNITEVMFNNTTIENNWIELYCIDDRNSGNGNSLLYWKLDDLDGADEKIFKNVMIGTGEFALLHFNDTVKEDEMNSSDGNGDGVLDAYTAFSNQKLHPYGDQVILQDAGNIIVDAVCWAYDDKLPYSYERTDLNYMAEIGQWNSNNTVNCVDAENVRSGFSIARNQGEADTNSKADWHILETPNPGAHYNTSDTYPSISNIRVQPVPVEETLPPLTDANVTVKLTDDKGIRSANLTWTLNGDAQGNIALADNGIGADATAADDNWSALFPGQPDGSTAVLSIEVFDTAMQKRASNPMTIHYRAPQTAARLLITEVMLTPIEGNDWVEIYCENDENDGNGYNMTGWHMDDMDGAVEHTFEGTLVRSGEYLVVHFDEDSADENASSDGNSDGIIDVYSISSNNVLSKEGDQVVLRNDEDVAVDALAWQKDGILVENEQNDVIELMAYDLWASHTVESCIDTTDIPEGRSLARRLDVLNDEYLDRDSAEDWYFDPSPTMGEEPDVTPVQFQFNVLNEGPAFPTVDNLFVVNWTLTGSSMLMDLVNVSLYHYKDDLNSNGVFIDYLDPYAKKFQWDVEGLDFGNYYLQAQVKDTINPSYKVNTTYPLEVAAVVPPNVIGTDPEDNSADVDASSHILVSFDKEVDIDSFVLGTTFIITPEIDGNISLKDEKTVEFTPDHPLEPNTTYRVEVLKIKDTEGMELVAPYKFAFKTGEARRYLLSGAVSPGEATVSVGGIEIGIGEGRFEIMLGNGSYILDISMEGYEPYTTMVNISGAEVELEEIELKRIRNLIKIGPFKDGDAAVQGINVSFTLNSTRYSVLTDSKGVAEFHIHLEAIPEGVLIKAEKDGETTTWKWMVDEDPYGFFTVETESQVESGSNTVLWIIILVLIVLISGIVAAIIIVLRRPGKENEAQNSDIQSAKQVGQTESHDLTVEKVTSQNQGAGAEGEAIPPIRNDGKTI